MKIYKIALFLALSSWCYGQNTMIHNVGFENGVSSNYSASSCDYSDPDDFEADVHYWSGWDEGGWESPDWIRIDDQFCLDHVLGGFLPGSNTTYLHYSPNPDIILSPNPYLGSRVVMFNEYSQGNSIKDVAILSPFISKPLTGVTYTVRIKYAPIHKSNNHFRVHFTTEGDNWDGNTSGNQKMMNVHQESHWKPETGGSSVWHITQFEVTIPHDKDDLKHIVLECEDGAFLVDDIEMWPKCDPNMVISQKQYDDHFFYNQGWYQNNPIITQSSNSIQTDGTEVRVWDFASHTFKAVSNITLKPGFHAEYGSEFAALLGPCNGTNSTWNWPKWTKSFKKNGTSFTNYENAVGHLENTSNGDVYVLSNTTSGGDQNILVSRIDKNGDLVESVSIGEPEIDEEAHGLVLSYDQNHLIIVGATTQEGEEGQPDKNLMVLKVSLELNSLGALKWTHHWGNEVMDEVAYQIEYDEEASSSYFVLGATDVGGEQRINVSAIADAGPAGAQVQWYNTYNDGTTGYDEMATSFVAKSDATGLVIAGLRDYGSYNHAYTIETDRSGALSGKGYIAYSLDGDVTAPHLLRMGSGNYALATSIDHGGNHSAVVMKFDNNMAMLWGQEYALNGMDDHYGISVQEEGSEQLMLGTYHTDPQEVKVVGTIIDIDGNVVSAAEYATMSSVQDLQSMARTENGYVFRTRMVSQDGFGLIKADHQGLSSCMVAVSVNQNDLNVESGDLSDFTDEGNEYSEAILDLNTLNTQLAELDDCGTIEEGLPEALSASKVVKAFEVSVYPNPTSNGVQIQLSTTGASTITLSNTSGQVLFQKEASGSSHYVDLSHYAEGIYLIKVENTQGASVHRLVKK